MKLGELITALEDFKLHTIGVDEDTEVLIVVREDPLDLSIEDVVVELRKASNYGQRQTTGTVMIEAALR